MVCLVKTITSFLNSFELSLALDNGTLKIFGLLREDFVVKLSH